MTQHAPGVYYQTVDAGAPPVTPFRTDITGFVGLAERGPIDLPVPVQSWRQFVSWYGSFTGTGFLAYAVRAFFENGGRRCWIVRVASLDPAGGAVASAITLGSIAGPVWQVRASSPGAWGDALAVNARERNRAQVIAEASSPDGTFSSVRNVSGFGRATLVRISQPGLAPQWKVISDADPHAGRIYWMHPDHDLRLPYDAPLHGIDPSAPLLLSSVEYALTVSEAGRLVRLYDGLSLVPEHPRYAPALLLPPTPTIDPATGVFVSKPPEPVVVEELRDDVRDMRGLQVDPFERLVLTGGRDGLAALVVRDFVGEPIAPDDGADAVAYKRRGLRALEELTEIGLLAIPDAQVRPVELHAISAPEPCIPDPCIDNPPADPVPIRPRGSEQPPSFGDNDLFLIQSEMILQCESKRDRFALLDAPYTASSDPVAGIRGVSEWRARFDTKFASLSYPWLRVVEPLSTAAPTRVVPPSGHVAGMTAATDLEIGVHKAPANHRLEWAVDASVVVDDERHGILNSAGVNVLRTTGGRGLRMQGARTMSSDTDWRFLNVRRLVSMIEKALETALQWAVFEPNDAITRARITMSVTFFLLGLHEAGMLAGATPEESFVVKCDLENNLAADRDLGHLIVEVGVAPSKPFEFVVLRVGRVHDALEVTDASESFSVAGLGV